MDRDDPEKLADELEREADDMARQAGEVQRRVDHARQEWERKRADESVPGALPPDRGEESEDEDSADV